MHDRSSMRPRTLASALALAAGAAIAAGTAVLDGDWIARREARVQPQGDPAFRGTPAIEFGRPVVATFVNFGPEARAGGERGLGSARVLDGRSFIRTPHLEAEAAVDLPDLKVHGRLARPGGEDGAVRSHARLSRTLRVVGAPRGSRVRIRWEIDYDVRFRAEVRRGGPPEHELRVQTRLRDGRDRPVGAFEIRDGAAEGRGPYVGAQTLVVELVAGVTYEVDTILEAFTAAAGTGAFEGTVRQRLDVEG